MSKTINALLLFLCVTVLGCQKKDSSNNPCDGLMNESPPTTLIIQFLAKATGHDLILEKDVETGDISVTDLSTGKPASNWRLVKTESASAPFKASLQLAVFATNAAQQSYRMDIKQLGSVTLAYTTTKKATGDPCKPEVYPLSDIKISDHAYSVFQHEGRTYPNMLIVEF